MAAGLFGYSDQSKADTYEAVACTACRRVHLVNPTTGKVFGRGRIAGAAARGGITDYTACGPNPLLPRAAPRVEGGKTHLQRLLRICGHVDVALIQPLTQCLESHSRKATHCCNYVVKSGNHPKRRLISNIEGPPRQGCRTCQTHMMIRLF
jgi:hypothetical protein